MRAIATVTVNIRLPMEGGADRIHEVRWETGDTVARVLEKVEGQAGRILSEKLLDAVSPSLLVTVNGELLKNEEIQTREVFQGEKVTVLAALVGG
jgi:sulfur carrier protein ThiS